jgi:hypothetical protein
MLGRDERASTPGWHLGLLVALVLALWIPRWNGPIDLRYDAGAYYVLGTSLAEGRGYRLTNEPGDIQAVQYPPLLPAFVAAHQRLLRTSDPLRVGPVLRLSFLVLSVLYALATYAMARQFLEASWALLVAAVTSLQHFTVFLSDLCFAELPFGLATVLFVAVYRGSHAARLPLLMLLGLAEFFLRSAGIALLAAWIVDAWLHRRRSESALALLTAVVAVAGWNSYVRGVVSGVEYQRPVYGYQRAGYQYYNVPYAQNLELVDPFRPELGTLSASALVRRVLVNAVSVVPRLGEAVSASRELLAYALSRLHHRLPSKYAFELFLLAPVTVLGGLVVLGLVLLARKGDWLVPLYAAASVFLICLTPWPRQFTRYLSPLTPFLAIAASAVVSTSSTSADPARRQQQRLLLGSAMAIFVLLAEGLVLRVTFRTFYRPASFTNPEGKRASSRLFYYDRHWAAHAASLDWLGKTASPHDVVATSTPHWSYLRNGRKAVLPPMEADPEQAQRLLDSVPVRFLVIDDPESPEIGRRYAEPVVRMHPELWELVFSSGSRVYRRR